MVNNHHTDGQIEHTKNLRTVIASITYVSLITVQFIIDYIHHLLTQQIPNNPLPPSNCPRHHVITTQKSTCNKEKMPAINPNFVLVLTNQISNLHDGLGTLWKYLPPYGQILWGKIPFENQRSIFITPSKVTIKMNQLEHEKYRFRVFLRGIQFQENSIKKADFSGDRKRMR